MTLRTRLARKILCTAESLAVRLDRREVVKITSFTFTFEHRHGIVLRKDGRGCPVAYLRDADYDLAWSQSDTLAPLTDAGAATIRDGLTQ